jgi:hypothetical protein
MREDVMQRVEEAITLLYHDVDMKYTGVLRDIDPAEKMYLRIKIDMTEEMILSHIGRKILEEGS